MKMSQFNLTYWPTGNITGDFKKGIVHLSQKNITKDLSHGYTFLPEKEHKKRKDVRNGCQETAVPQDN